MRYVQRHSTDANRSTQPGLLHNDNPYIIPLVLCTWACIGAAMSIHNWWKRAHEKSWTFYKRRACVFGCLYTGHLSQNYDRRIRRILAHTATKRIPVSYIWRGRKWGSLEIPNCQIKPELCISLNQLVAIQVLATMTFSLF